MHKINYLFRKVWCNEHNLTSETVRLELHGFDIYEVQRVYDAYRKLLHVSVNKISLEDDEVEERLSNYKDKLRKQLLEATKYKVMCKRLKSQGRSISEITV